MPGAGSKVVKTLTCEECGKQFTRLVWTTSQPKYCTKACRTNAWGRKKVNRRWQDKITLGLTGSYGLEYDPVEDGPAPRKRDTERPVACGMTVTSAV